MAVPSAVHGPDDRRARAVIAIDEGAYGRRLKERRIDERDERGDDARAIDDTEARDERRQLSRFVIRIEDEARRHRTPIEGRDDRRRIVADDNDDVFDIGRLE